METRTDRVGLLLDQLATSTELSRGRLDGLTDDEYWLTRELIHHTAEIALLRDLHARLA